MSPTGRMGHEELRASQLTGAQITGSSGTEMGTISDVIINPASGRLDFAIVSLSAAAGTSTGSATSPSGSSSSQGTSSSPGTSSSSSSGLGTGSQGGASTPGGLSSTASSSTGGKQVAVPWALLRASTSSTSGTGAASTSGQQPTFVYSGDTSKLDSAPTFDATTDLSQPGWRHSVFSYFGLSARSATGGAASPGGTSEESSGSSSTTSPQTSGSSSGK